MRTFVKVFHMTGLTNDVEYEIAKIQRKANAEVLSTSVSTTVGPTGRFQETIVVVFEKNEE